VLGLTSATSASRNGEYVRASCASCPVCDAVRRARAEARLVFENDLVVAFAETATHSGTVWIVPLSCRQRVSDASPLELRAVGAALQRVAKLAYDAFDDPDFNVAFYSAPNGLLSAFHWYAVYVPHLVEDCSLARIQYGMAATSMLPEIAAATLRAVDSLSRDATPPRPASFRHS